MDDIVSPFIEVSKLMTSRGWCLEASGNLSMIVKSEFEIWDMDPIIFDTGLFLPQLEGRTILMTRSGSFLSDIPKDPENNLGLYLAGIGGRYLSLLWGEGAPTSEYLSHLLIFASSGGRTGAVIHAHMDEVEMLQNELPDYPSGLPNWIGWVPNLPPGSLDLAQATAQEIQRYDVMLWHGHGIIAPGRDLEDCFSRLERFSEWVRPILEKE